MTVTPAGTQVIRHEHAGGSWTLATRASAPAVRAVVPAYVGYAERSTRPVRRIEVPHPNVTVIINLGAPLAVHAPALAAPGMAYGSFAAGLFDTVAVTENTGDSSGIELNVTPLGMWQLCGVPMHRLANVVVSLSDLLGASAMELEERLRSLVDWDARFTLLDSVLTARLARRGAPPAALPWAWAQLTRDARPESVTATAGALQWSRRRLADAFREYVGLTPKAVARIVRFDRVVQRVRGSGVTRWSSLAYECGYADQAHLAREFREFAGITPGEFVRRQSVDHAGVIAG